MPLGELTPPADDLRSDLEAAFNETPDTPEPTPEEAQPEAPPADPAAPKEDHPTDPTRYADGKFKSSKAPEPAPEKPPTTDTQVKASVEPSTADAPPAGWSADAKAEWAALSPALKAAVLKRETDISEGGRQWSDQKRRYEEEWAPLEMRARQLGISRQEGLNRLLTADHMLRTNAPAAIQQLMQSYGVTLEHLTGQQPAQAQGGQQTVHDPRLDPILARFEQDDARSRARLETIVTEFSQSPDHPHFNAVVDQTLHLLPAIKAAKPYATPEQWLQEAYDSAVWANPGTRQSLIEARTQAQEQERLSAAAAQTAKAKAASVSVTGHANGSSAPPQPETIREALLQAWSGNS